jgi:oxidase EvaA
MCEFLPKRMGYKLELLKSALSIDGVESIDNVINWILLQNKSTHISVNRVDLMSLKNWFFSNDIQNIYHKTGKFFSIDGITVKTNWGTINEWDQPIINQPEIGFLGFITQEINGVLHFLLQAKIEPGNVNYVQLSPTLQATRSNYTQIHRGNKPFFLEYFLNVKSENILFDQLQSEQGARFLRKRNRNIIIKVDEPIKPPSNFMWLTLGQLKLLMKMSNIVNMDTRTVISGILFDGLSQFNYEQIMNEKGIVPSDLGVSFFKSAILNEGSLHSIEEIITFLTKHKSFFEIFIERIPLTHLRKWEVKSDEIVRPDNKYFKIIGVNVEIDNREVSNWDQPMLMPLQEGICAMIVKNINGVMHFLMLAKLECGNHDIIEFAPTIQHTSTGNDLSSNCPPFLNYVLESNEKQIIYDTYQSEEGGRFYREQNRYLIVLADEDFKNEVPENYIWMTLYQIQVFLKFNNYINIQARSLIAAISYL